MKEWKLVINTNADVAIKARRINRMIFICGNATMDVNIMRIVIQDGFVQFAILIKLDLEIFGIY